MSEELIKRARELTQGPPSDWTWEAAVERQTERLSLMRQLADALEASQRTLFACQQRIFELELGQPEKRELVINRRAETEG